MIFAPLFSKVTVILPRLSSLISPVVVLPLRSTTLLTLRLNSAASFSISLFDMNESLSPSDNDVSINLCLFRDGDNARAAISLMSLLSLSASLSTFLFQYGESFPIGFSSG